MGVGSGVEAEDGSWRTAFVVHFPAVFVKEDQQGLVARGDNADEDGSIGGSREEVS